MASTFQPRDLLNSRKNFCMGTGFYSLLIMLLLYIANDLKIGIGLPPVQVMGILVSFSLLIWSPYALRSNLSALQLNFSASETLISWPTRSGNVRK